MATVYDLLPADQKTRFPLEGMTPEAQKWLGQAVPDGYPADRAARLGGLVAQVMPRMTMAARAISTVNKKHPRVLPEAASRAAAQQMADVDYAGLDPAVKARRRVADAFSRAMPSKWATPDAPTVPPAANLAEHIEDIAGGAAAFVPAATGLTAAATLVGVPALGASMLGMGGAMMLPAGTVKQRAIRGAVGAAAAGVAAPIGAAVEGSVFGAAPTLAAGSTLAETAGAVVNTSARTIGRAAVAGGVFGGIQPVAENAVEGALHQEGEPAVPRLTPEDIAKSAVEMFFFDMASHAVHGVAERGKAAVQAATPVPTENMAAAVDANLARMAADPNLPEHTRQQAGLAPRMLAPAFPAPRGRAGVEMVAAGATAARAILQQFALFHASGRRVSMTLGHTRVNDGIVADVRVYPWDNHGGQVRVLVLDRETGGIHVASFADMRGAMQGLQMEVAPPETGAAATAPPAGPRSPAAGQAPTSGGNPGVVPGNDGAPAPVAASTPRAPRPRVIVDMPFRDSKSAQRAAEGLNRTNPDLEATVVVKGGKVVVEVNGDAAEAPRNPAPRSAPQPAAPAAPAPNGEGLSQDDVNRMFGSGVPGAAPSGPAAAPPPPAAEPAPPAPTHRQVAKGFPTERSARRWMAGTPGAEGGRVVASQTIPGMWDIELPNADADAYDAVSAERKARADAARAARQNPAPAAPAADPPAPEPVEPPLHPDLAGAKPRYGYGAKNFELDFESDADRAAFIASQAKKSRKDAEYRKHLTDQGFSDEEIAAHGQRVRDTIKGMARDAKPDKPLRVPRHERQKPADPPAPEPPAAEPPAPPVVEPPAPAPAPEPPAAEGGDLFGGGDSPPTEFKPAYAVEHHGSTLTRMGPDRKLTRLGGPTPEESKAVKAGVHGKTFAEAAEWIANSSPEESTREIAKKVFARLRDMERMGFVEGRVKVRTKLGSKNDGAYGRRFKRSGVGEASHYIDVDPDAGAVIVLHELVHAATLDLLEDRRLPGLTDPRMLDPKHPDHSRISRARTDLNALFSHVAALGQKSTEHTVRYGTTSAAELLAAGMSDRTMQKWLESVPFDDGSAWTKFVDVVRRALGLERKQANALDELLRVGEELMRPEGSEPEPAEPEAAPEPPAPAAEPPAAPKTFAEHFAEAWAKRLPSDSHEDVAERAAAASGMAIPPDFDPLVEGERLTRAANAAASAGDLFGGSAPETLPTAAPAPAPPVVPSAADPVGGAEAESAPTSSEATTVDTSTLHRHETFQGRDMARMGGFSDPEAIQSRLREGNGYNHDEIVKNPLWFWTDAKGELGPEGRRYIVNGHHRYELATNDWKKVGDQYVSQGTVRRTLPAVEIKGDLAAAQKAAENANHAVRPPTHLENAHLAVTLEGKGYDARTIADRMNIKAGAVQGLLDLGRLHPGVLSDFFEERGGKPVVDYGYGEALGRAVKTHPDYFQPETQRLQMRAVLDGEFKNVSEYKSGLKLVTDVLDATKQEDVFKNVSFTGFTPQQVTQAAGKALREIALIKSGFAAMERSIRKAQSAAGNTNSGAELLAFLQERIAKAKLLQKDFSSDRIRDRIIKELRAGKPVPDILKGIKTDIDDRMGEDSVNSIVASEMEVDAMDHYENALEGEQSEGAFDDLHAKFLLADVIRSTDKAVDVMKRKYGKQFSVLRYVSNGKVVSTVDLDPPLDHWQQYALVRYLNAATGWGGGNVALPPGDPTTGKPGPRDIMHKTGPATTHEIHQVHTALGLIMGDEGFRALGKAFGTNDHLFWHAVNAPPEKAALEGHGGQLSLTGVEVKQGGMTREQYRRMLPVELRDKVEPVAALMKSLLEAENADRRARGIPEITSRFYDNYISHTVDSIGALDHLVTMLDEQAAHDPDAMRARKLSYYRRRGGFDDGAQKSFQESFRRYVDTTVTTRHDRELIESIREYLSGSEGSGPDSDVLRQSTVRTWTRAWLFREKNHLEDQVNNIARRLLFTKAAGATAFATEALAVKWLGAAAVNAAKQRLQPLANSEHTWQYVDPKASPDITFTVPKAWTKVGTTKKGLDVYVGNDGHLLAGAPEWRPAFKLIAESAALVPDHLHATWAHIRGSDFSEEMARQQILRDQRLLRFERDPWSAIVSGWNKGMTSAFVGFNFPVATKIMLSNLGAIHNRYGPITATRATLRAVDMMLRKAGRARARAAYEAGKISAGEMGRRTAPLTAEEAAFDYLRLGQGSQLYYRQMAAGEMGRNFTPTKTLSQSHSAFNRTIDRLSAPLHKLAYYVGPFGPHAIAEVVTRGIQLHAAWLDGIDRGMTMQGIRDAYDATEAGKQSAATDILRTSGQPGTMANHVAAEAASTLFTYDRTGQPYYMGSSTGRLFGSLSTWGTQAVVHNFLRPLEGAARVGAEVTARPFMGGKDPGWASADHYRAARLFAAQVVGAGVMTYLTDKTRLRLYAGTNTSGLILALMAMRSVYKANHHGHTNKDFERYLTDAFAEEGPAMVGSLTAEGRALHGGRGVFGMWFSPVVQTAADIEKRGLLDTALNLATTRIVPYKGQWMKMVRSNPKMFRDNPNNRWVADVLGVKSFIDGSPFDQAKAAVGLLPESHTERSKQIPRKQRARYDARVERIRREKMPGGPVRAPGSLGSY